MLLGDARHGPLQVGPEERAERRGRPFPGGQRVEQVGRLARHGPRSFGHGFGQGQPAFEVRDLPRRPQLLQQPVALLPQPGPAGGRGGQRGIVGQHGQEGGFRPAQVVRGPAEIEPRGGVQADDVAAERGVGGEERQDGALRAPRLEPQGQDRFPGLFDVGPRPVFAGQAHHLHGDGAAAAADPAGPQVLARGPGQGQRIDARMDEEALVFEADQGLVEPLRHSLAGREAPLAVRRRPGAEEPPLGAEEHRGNGIVEADDRHGEPGRGQEREGDRRPHEEAGSSGPGFLPRASPPSRRADGGRPLGGPGNGDMYLGYVSPDLIPCSHWTISTHWPFVLAWRAASYMASTARPGW